MTARPRHIAAPLFVLLIGALGTACASKPVQEVTYLQAYEQKQFADAFDKAAARAQDPQAADRERAQLVAGMSAQALGRRDEARRLLTPLRASQDKDIAGRAETTLGLIAAQTGDNRAASVLLKSGARKLDGQDAALANLHAGAAMERIGLRDMASRQYASGVAETTDPALRSMLTERAKPSAYFVQLGAFATRAAADRRAQQVLQSRTAKSEPAPVVVEQTVNARTLFAVQVGPYSTPEAARLAQIRLGPASSTITHRRAN
jgi:hypothetical protein